MHTNKNYGKNPSLDLSFDYTTTSYSEFEAKRSKLVIELSFWIGPKMNYIHDINHNNKFWLRVLRNYLKSSVNKLHIYKDDRISISRSLVNVDAFGNPPRLRSIRTGLSYIYHFLSNHSKEEDVLHALKLNESIAIGHRANLLSADGKGKALNEYYPLLKFPDLGARKRWHSVIKSETNPVLRKILEAIPYIY